MPKAVDYLPYTGPRVTRAEAKAAGAKRYFTGKPCRNGHLCERYVANEQCIACNFAQNQRYEQDNRDYVDSYRKAWRKANKDKLHAKTMAWRDANRERWDEAARAWQKANRELVAAKRAEWYHANVDRRRVTNKTWREENLERIKEVKKVWLAANKLRTRVYTENRRARKLANGGSHTPEQIEELYAKQRRRCTACGKSIRNHYEIDHIIPITRGGSNDISNIQLLCLPCNRSKHNKLPEQWAREQGRLL
jgi:5-methylcytosine-specific restriction endonuclease McrA